MKKIIYLMIMIVLVFACKSKKVIQQTKTDQKAKIENTVLLTDQAKESTTVIKTDNTSTGKTKVTVTSVYDSNKPVSTVTGKPPLISETTTKETTEEKKDVKTDIAKTSDKAATKSEASKSDITTSVETKKTEIPKTPAIKYWLILAVLIVGTFLIWKYFSKIKALFNKIFKKK